MFAGTEFLVALMPNEIEQAGTVRLRIAVATKFPTTLSVRMPSSAAPLVYRLGANTIQWLAVPESLEVRRIEQPRPAAIELRSDAPVVVYVFNSFPTSTDAYTAIPVAHWGKDYVVVSLPNDHYTPRTGDTSVNRLRDLMLRRSQWMVIAAEDSTVVTFVPRVRTAGGKDAGVAQTVILHRGECYLVQADSTARGAGDMTGTVIRANKPIGVLSGHVRVGLPFGLSPETDTKDHLVEMLPPLSALGTRYITVPFAVGTGDLFRAVAVAPQTQLTVFGRGGNPVQVTLNAVGEVADFPFEAAPLLWVADKPFLLAQFMYSGIVSGSISIPFDPCMVIVPPLEQRVQQAHFMVPDTTLVGFPQFRQHWVNLLADSAAAARLRLNGQPVSGWQPVSAMPEFSFVRLQLLAGRTYELVCDTGGFVGTLYGVGYADSYGLVLGSSLLPADRAQDSRAPQIRAATGPCGVLNLSIRDDSSGLAFVAVIPESTWNYQWQLLRRSLYEYELRAWVQDSSQDAAILVEARDNAGNGARYRWQYWGERFQLVPSEVVFTALAPQDSLCTLVELRNTGRDTLRLTALSFRERRLRVGLALPVAVPPGATLQFPICVVPAGDTSSLTDTVWLVGRCRVRAAVVVRATVELAELTGWGYDFGDVLVRSTAWGAVGWTNSGNVPTTAVGIRFRRTDVFAVDSAGFFPYRLRPGDTLRLPVQFRPIQRGGIEDTVVLYTASGLQVPVLLRGRGVAPVVQGMVVDWGRRRIGRQYDSVALLRNAGDVAAQLRVQSDSGDTAELLLSVPSPLQLQPGEERALPVAFRPLQRGTFRRVVRWEVEPGVQAPVELVLQGQGIAPELAARAVDFGTVRLREFRDTVAAVLWIAGDAPLRLQQLWLEGADAAAFAVLTAPSLPLELSPGDTLRLPLRFRPSRLGAHRAHIVLQHDGAPPYATDTLWVELLGMAVEPPFPDTLRADWAVGLELPALLAACVESPAQLCLRNTGNVELRWVELQPLEGLPPEAIPPLLPRVLPPGERWCMPLLLPGFPAGAVRIRFAGAVVAVFSNGVRDSLDTLRFSLAEERQVAWQRWSITAPGEPLRAEPGSVVELVLEGRLPVLSDGSAEGYLCLQAQPRVWELYPSGLQMEIAGSGVPVRIEQRSREELCLGVPSLRLPPGEVPWRLRVPVRVFLAPEELVEVPVAAMPMRTECVLGDSAVLRLWQPGICAERLRTVRLQEVPALAIRQLFPNPAAGEFAVLLWSSQPQPAKVQLFSAYGELCREWELQCPAGEFLRKFELHGLPSGVYSVRVSAAAGIQHHMLVIQW